MEGCPNISLLCISTIQQSIWQLDISVRNSQCNKFHLSNKQSVWPFPFSKLKTNWNKMYATISYPPWWPGASAPGHRHPQCCSAPNYTLRGFQLLTGLPDLYLFFIVAWVHSRQVLCWHFGNHQSDPELFNVTSPKGSLDKNIGCYSLD